MSDTERGFYKEHGRSDAAKLVLLGLNLAGVLVGAWLLFGGARVFGGGPLFGGAPLFGGLFQQAESVRRVLIVTCSFVYFLRIIMTTYVMVKRRVSYGEGFGVGLWIVAIHLTMACLGGMNTTPVGAATWCGVALYVIGSATNTASEYLRKRWKDDPSHAGKLYTGGLFRFAVHINYFGDVVLFSGFALVTGVVWAFVIPALMAALFIFVNIPMLDRHLAEHYGEPFERYRRRTARFVPFVY
ncbi:DUF1295 domain-containing protein [Microbacterium sp. STN6]|uniref:DUF1295 domain-containing protein n=1 Tax=Microbacterium sp. STN6 TaxID=2995588 RepID=UPI002260EB50|nr:DUF1295 domain-containing protein [Microbacterium sp. STN6]MCX7522894.1 DUF1295 domain-containing protein [Microbacterium sp. STN6]